MEVALTFAEQHLNSEDLEVDRNQIREDKRPLRKRARAGQSNPQSFATSWLSALINESRLIVASLSTKSMKIPNEST